MQQKLLKLRTPEAVIKRLKTQKVSVAEFRIYRLVKNFGHIYA